MAAEGEPVRPAGSGRAPDDGGALEGLVEALRPWLTPSTVIVCIGNDLRGDDGAGPAVAAALADAVPWAVLDTQTAPESYLGKIAGLHPDCVVVIDTLNFSLPPGTISLVKPDEIAGQGPGTHGPAPVLFLEALAERCSCRCAVLGIQPMQIEFGAPLSPPVARAVERIAQAFRRLARPAPGGG
ncbi:MAG: hydrogenase maturation protease [Planctomycetota bacterium]